MEAGRGRVGLVGELTAGMKAGEDDLDGGQARFAVKVDRDAAAVVLTVQDPSLFKVTATREPKPLAASSTPLSTISQIR